MPDSSLQAPSGRAVRLLLLVVAVAVLLLLALWFGRLAAEPVNSEPLNPNDSMEFWVAANPAQRQATAELLVAELERAELLGPQTRARLASAGGKQALAQAIIVELDAAANPDKMAYVAPGTSMLQVARSASERLSWGQ